jgi:hypothetical protein
MDKITGEKLMKYKEASAKFGKMPDKLLITNTEAAEFIGVAPCTLLSWSLAGYCPKPATEIRGRKYWKTETLKKWIDADCPGLFAWGKKAKTQKVEPIKCDPKKLAQYKRQANDGVSRLASALNTRSV